ncbi:MAG: beta-lactamase family protein [bacterium]|nr:beta-lactamase family protein [bacterium]
MKTIISILISLLASFMLLLSCSSFPVYTPPEKAAVSNWGTVSKAEALRFQSALNRAVTKHGVLGLQASIIKPDGKTWSGTGGHADSNREEELKKENLLRIGSITKLFTATVIMKLYQDGKVNLDDTINKWFPNLKNSNTITIRMLLNHTSGIENLWLSKYAMMRTLFGKEWQVNELVELITEMDPFDSPGKSFHYSNSNYVLIGKIVEELTAKKMSRVIFEYINTPCRLENTWLLPEKKAEKKLITGFDRVYIPTPGTFHLEPDDDSWSSFAYTAGSMASTTIDLVTFIDSFYKEKIISRDVIKKMYTFSQGSTKINPDVPKQTAYGLGLARFSIGGDTLWGHMGGLMGFESIVLHCIEKNYSIAVSGNLSVSKVADVTEDLIKSMRF